MATATPKTIVAFGELLWDVFPTGEVLGGAPANFAYRINSLGDEARIVTRLGLDNRGRRASELLAAKGMQIDCIQWDELIPTGTVDVIVDANGSPDYIIHRAVAYDFIESTEDLMELARSADAICFGTLAQRSEQSRRTLYQMLDETKGARVLDLNLRRDCYSKETIDDSLNRSTILKLNETEAAYLSELYGMDRRNFAMNAVHKWKLDCCVVTLGAQGVNAASPSEAVSLPVPDLPSPVVDTVGCGDAFTAAFVHHFLRGGSLQRCCEAGNLLGACVARTRGGMAPVELKEI